MTSTDPDPTLDQALEAARRLGPITFRLSQNDPRVAITALTIALGTAIPSIATTDPRSAEDLYLAVRELLSKTFSSAYDNTFGASK